MDLNNYYAINLKIYEDILKRSEYISIIFSIECHMDFISIFMLVIILIPYLRQDRNTYHLHFACLDPKKLIDINDSDKQI